METREIMERLFEEISQFKSSQLEFPQLELPPISPKVYEAIKQKRVKHRNMEGNDQCLQIKRHE